MIARLLKLVLIAQACAGFALGALLTYFFAGPGVGAMRLGAGGLIGLLVSFLGHPLVVAIDFAITRRAKSAAPKALQLGPLAALRTYAREVAAGMRGFSWAHPFLSATPAPSPVEPVHPLPILFIHGYFCNRAIWLPFMRAVAREGFACEAVTLDPPFDRIESYAPTIERAVNGLLERSGSPQLILVAHSMGGLAARAWMRVHGSLRVTRLITLGTPHAGTVMASLGHGGNVSQMRRMSPWLAQLSASESEADRGKMLCIYSYHDNIVAPQLTATLEGARNVGLGGIGHVELVYHAQVREVVLREVRGLVAAADRQPRRIERTASSGP